MRRIFLPLIPLVAVAIAAAAAATPLSAHPPLQFEPACTGPNPYFVTSCYSQGMRPDEPALVTFRDTTDNSDHGVLATAGEIGSTYGIAYRPEEDALYVGAYHKRGTAFGPGGPGMIYRVEVSTATVTQWLEVPNAGADRHDPDDDYWPDTPARDIAGTLSLGDLETDGEHLYVMNLSDRKIYRYRIDDKAFLGTIDIGSVNEQWAGQARPMGLAFRNGKLYHGLVHSAFASQDMADLQAYVYETDPDGANVRLVNQFSLDYDRGNVISRQDIPARWRPWRSGWNTVGSNTALGAYPQPMLSDIEFADNGDMILGFRDRNGDMTFFNPGGRNPPGEGTSIPAGDILIARFNGDTWDTVTEPEFYRDDHGPAPPNMRAHDESGYGGLARVRDADVVVTTGLAPLRISSGGAFWFHNVSGDNTAREELYNFESEVNFGKANGLGDIELLCGPEQATETPTATETATETATPTETATTTTTPTVSVTPTTGPSVTSTATATATPVVPTSTGTVTAVMTDVPRQQTAPPATSELPTLPQTGGGPSSLATWLLLALAAVVVVLASPIRRRLRGNA